MRPCINDNILKSWKIRVNAIRTASNGKFNEDAGSARRKNVTVLTCPGRWLDDAPGSCDRESSRWFAALWRPPDEFAHRPRAQW